MPELININGHYYKKEFVMSVIDEMIHKIPVWEAGLEKPSQCEKFAFEILREHITSR